MTLPNELLRDTIKINTCITFGDSRSKSKAARVVTYKHFYTIAADMTGNKSKSARLLPGVGISVILDMDRVVSCSVMVPRFTVSPLMIMS